MEKPRRELTITAILLGALLAVVMGAANVYLGLKAGMTVSASIPAAVVAMGILAAMRRRNILEANMVQTGASAGESLAAGVIFTLPALVLIGYWQEFSFWTTAIVSLAGGLLGILFMIPMRKVFIVDSPELPYPEGVACAEVLRAGATDDESEDEQEASSGGLALIAGGLLVGALFKIATKSLGLIKDGVSWATVRGDHVYFFGLEISPALMAVGLIVGLPIACQVFAGSVLAWFIALPMLAVSSLTEVPQDAADIAMSLWSSQIRFLGVGAMVVAGFASIWSVRGGLMVAVQETWRQFRDRAQDRSSLAHETRDIPTSLMLIVAAVCVVLTYGTYVHMTGGAWSISLLTTAIMIVMAFFFTAVASYIVGLVGNSNSPVSGMTISALLATALLVTMFGFEGMPAMVATLGVAGVVCCAACTSGDVCNDLKTGYLVGASPRNQQIMQIVGVTVACVIMGPVLNVLHIGSQNEARASYEAELATYEKEISEGKAPDAPKEQVGGIGSKAFSAPQATLMQSIVEGFFGDRQLPWGVILLGAVVGVMVLLADPCLKFYGFSMRLHLMPIAVGIYLPLGLTTSIFLGGVLSYIIKSLAVVRRRQNHAGIRSILIASGLIAGESLAGVAIGLLTFYNINNLELGSGLNASVAKLLAIAVLAAVCAGIVYWTLRVPPETEH